MTKKIYTTSGGPLGVFKKFFIVESTIEWSFLRLESEWPSL